MRAIFHARPVAGHHRRRERDREGKFEELGRAQQRLAQQLRALLIGRLVVQLLVLLGGVVRVADAAVDERRRGRDPAALGDLAPG